MLAIVDGDSILYRATWDGATLDQAKRKYLDILSEYISLGWCDNSIVYIKGEGNWRYDVFSKYKGNRKENPHAEMITALVEWLGKEKLAIRAFGCEADDLVRRRAEKCKARNQNYVVISADKDLDCIEGNHIRPGPKGIKQYIVTKEQADYNYYYQVLIGDSSDYIKSPYLLGPKKAEEILKSTDRKNWKAAIEKEYKDRCGTEWFHAIMFTGSLIHIQRYKDDMFIWDEEKGNFFDCGLKENPKCYKYK